MAQNVLLELSFGFVSYSFLELLVRYTSGRGRDTLSSMWLHQALVGHAYFMLRVTGINMYVHYILDILVTGINMYVHYILDILTLTLIKT